jgi:hypothetical protein
MEGLRNSAPTFACGSTYEMLREMSGAWRAVVVPGSSEDSEPECDERYPRITLANNCLPITELMPSNVSLFFCDVRCWEVNTKHSLGSIK